VVNRGMSVSVSAETAAWAEEFLHRHGVGPTDLLVGIAPGGGKNPGTTMLFKRWFPERYAAVADALAARHGARILLVGGPDEVELAETMRHSMQTEPILAAGQTTLQQLAGLLQRCRVVLANDSGPLHLAAAAGAATVALFGPSDPRLVAPLGERHRALWHPPECAPCYEPTTVRQTKVWTCHRGDVLCLRQIEVEEVVAAVEEVLDNQSA
jgi:ADP-heptose:LPS heptosyltransferase